MRKKSKQKNNKKIYKLNLYTSDIIEVTPNIEFDDNAIYSYNKTELTIGRRYMNKNWKLNNQESNSWYLCDLKKGTYQTIYNINKDYLPLNKKTPYVITKQLIVAKRFCQEKERFNKYPVFNWWKNQQEDFYTNFLGAFYAVYPKDKKAIKSTVPNIYKLPGIITLDKKIYMQNQMKSRKYRLNLVKNKIYINSKDDDFDRNALYCDNMNALQLCSELMNKSLNFDLANYTESNIWFLVNLQKGYFTELNTRREKYKFNNKEPFVLTRYQKIANILCQHKDIFKEIHSSNYWKTKQNNFFTNCLASYYYILPANRKLYETTMDDIKRVLKSNSNKELKNFNYYLYSGIIQQKQPKIIHSTLKTNSKIDVNFYDEFYYSKQALHNHTSNDKNAIHIHKYRSKNLFKLLEQDDVINEIQLIKSSNNHVTKHHNIINKTIHIICHNVKNNEYISYNFAVHYCETCGIYFDFYNSFMNQLFSTNQNIYDFILKCYDENNKILNLYTNSNIGDFHKESKLHKLGYTVGENGLNSSNRELLLKNIIKYNIMSAAEIKNQLEWNINFFSKNGNMKQAILCWKNDLSSINKGILSKKLKK